MEDFLVLTNIPLTQIRVNWKQIKKVDFHKIHEHANDIMKEGDLVHPIDLNRINKDSYVIAGNGRHRFFAHRLLGLTNIYARILNVQEK